MELFIACPEAAAGGGGGCGPTPVRYVTVLDASVCQDSELLRGVSMVFAGHLHNQCSKSYNHVYFSLLLL